MTGPILQSRRLMIPAECQQMICISEDHLVWLTLQGTYMTHHLNWFESLGDTDNQVMLASSWIETFAKALDIYTGNVQGLRMKDKDD